MCDSYFFSFHQQTSTEPTVQCHLTNTFTSESVSGSTDLSTRDAHFSSTRTSLRCTPYRDSLDYTNIFDLIRIDLEFI